MNFDIAYEFMLPALEYFAKVTHSYGWAIIFLTLAVRVLVWPLVAKSTRSMQKMSQLQPQMKALQDRYKDNPELFQKKTMEFYAKNKINPMGGCLPTLIQLPILFALYATFSGPPFGDRFIDVKVNVLGQEQAQHADKPTQAPTSTNSSPYLAEGVRAKVVVFPGETTALAGDSVNFGVRAAQGSLPEGFKPEWKIIGPNSHNPRDPAANPENADIDASGHATFLKPGEYHVLAKIPGIARNEPFYFIKGLGQVANGVELLKPEHWDSLSLILLFGATMFLSQKFSVATPKPAANQTLDEQQLIQQQTMKVMPLVTTSMFLFIPLPTGVYLYLVISNVLQTLQTFLIMKTPGPSLVNVMGESEEIVPKKNGFQDQRVESKEEKQKGTRNGKPQDSNKSTNKTSANKASATTTNTTGAPNGIKLATGKKKLKRKKN